MTIENSSLEDFADILKLYQNARDLQTERGMVVWPMFAEDIIIEEINDLRQFKVVIDGQTACVWAITLEDKAIWEEKDQDDAIYIHRIATHPSFRGHKFVNHIVEWAREYAIQKDRTYVRLDTLGDNQRLIKLYTDAGFDYLGVFILSDTSTLPGHYQREPLCQLFEMRVG